MTKHAAIAAIIVLSSAGCLQVPPLTTELPDWFTPQGVAQGPHDHPGCSPFPLLPGPILAGAIVPRECFTGYAETLASEEDRFGYRIDDYWTPASSEIFRAEAGIRRALRRAVADGTLLDAEPSAARDRVAYVLGQQRFILTNLPMYRRQYAGVIVGGSRRVHVNLFLTHPGSRTLFDDDWRDRLVPVVGANDFGEELWSIQYELASGRCVNFNVNGS